MPTQTITVSDDSDGLRLDRFLVSLMPAQSRSQIQRLIKEGHVHVAGREAKANQAVKSGQEIVVDAPTPARTEARSPGPAGPGRSGKVRATASARGPR